MDEVIVRAPWLTMENGLRLHAHVIDLPYFVVAHSSQETSDDESKETVN